MFEITVEDSFSAAHRLLNYHGKCENPHGHNWIVKVSLSGDILDDAGMLVDFKVVKKLLKETLELLDHKDLNEVFQTSPSSEHIAKFIYEDMKKKLQNIDRVSVFETPTSCATYFEK